MILLAQLVGHTNQRRLAVMLEEGSAV